MRKQTKIYHQMIAHTKHTTYWALNSMRLQLKVNIVISICLKGYLVPDFIGSERLLSTSCLDVSSPSIKPLDTIGGTPRDSPFYTTSLSTH